MKRKKLLPIIVLTTISIFSPQPQLHAVSRDNRAKAIQHCKAAEDCLKKEDYELAIKYFQKAVMFNPDRSKYSDQMNDAIKKAQSYHYNKATIAEKNKEYGGAKDHFEKAQLFKKHLLSSVKLTSVDRKIRELEKKASSIEINIFDKENDYKKALSAYKELWLDWPSNEKWVNRIKEIKVLIEEREVSKAQWLLKTNYKWQQALNTSKKLIDIYPDNKILKEIMQEAAIRVQAQQLVKKGKSSMNSKDYDNALDYYSKAVDIFPGYPGGKALRLKAAKIVNKEHRQKVKKSLANKNWSSAIDSLRKILITEPQNTTYKNQINVAKEEYAKQIVAQSERELLKNNQGKAIIETIKALSFNPANTMANDKFSATRSTIMNNSIRYIYIKDFTDATANRQGSKELTKTIANLIKNLNIPFLKITNYSKNADIEISGTLKAGGTRTTATTRQQQVKYQSGTQNAPNPNYNIALQNYNQAEQNLKRVQHQAANMQQTDNNKLNAFAAFTGSMATSSAISKYNQAQRNLAATPQNINKPIYAYYNCAINNVTVFGEFIYDLKIYDKKKHKTIVNETISATSEHSDRQIDAVPHVGIKGDPLELPNKDQIMEPLMDKSAKKLTKNILCMISDQFDDIKPNFNKLTALNNTNTTIEKCIASTLIMQNTSGTKPGFYSDYIAFLAKKANLSTKDFEKILK